MLDKAELEGIINLLANISAETEEAGLTDATENIRAIIEKLKKHL